MPSIKKRFSFDAAHRLDRLPESHKCHRLHGHTYWAGLVLTGELDENGFILDYGVLSDLWQPLHDALDHRYLNEVPGLEIPSTEKLAEWIWLRLRPSMPMLTEVVVEESETTEAHWP